MNTRPENWPIRLDEYLTEFAHTPFEWGRNDCVTIPAGWLIALGWPDPIYDLRGTWSSALGAARIFREGGGFLAMVDTRLRDLGAIPIPPLHARRGDLALVREPGVRTRTLIGIVEGGIIFSPGTHGLVRVPLSAATHAWRI